MSSEADKNGLDGLHALITGGGKGIGAAVAQTFKAAGARVSIVGRDEAALRAAVEAGWADAYAAVDVTDEAGLTTAFADLASRLGPIDVLVNNAGAAATGPFLKQSTETFQKMLAVNLMAAVTCSRLVLPAMLERGFGRIVNVASTAALKGYPYVSAYVTAKHAVLGFTRALALETAKKGVTVNAVCPGFTDTELVAGSVQTIVATTGRTVEEARAELARNNPQGRLIEPVEVARVVAMLAQRSSGSITGTAVPVAGGEV